MTVRASALRAILILAIALLALGMPASGFAKPPTATPTPSPSPSPTTTPPPPVEPELTAPEQRMENVIAAARVYLGIPYRLGAEGPDLMDCSGLIYRAFMDAGEGRRMSGARLGVRSYVRWFAAKGGLVLDETLAVRGDLAIWGAGQHMGIYLGDGRVISAVTSGVRVHALHGISLPLTGFLHPNWGTDGKVEPLDPSLLLDEGETPVSLVPVSAWAPALDPAADGLMPVRAGEERLDLRTATSRTFENPDGTFTTELHAQPIHYEVADPDSGETSWQPIDLHFTQVKGKRHKPDSAVVGASPVVVSAFDSDHEGGFLTLASAERSLALAVGQAGAEEAAPPVISADGRTVDYASLFGDGVGLRVLPRPDGARSFIVLRQAPESNQFTFRVAGDGLTATLEPDGSVALRDEAGLMAGRIPRPTLIDSTDIEGNGGGMFAAATSLSVADTDDGAQLISIRVARRFLDEAVYPAFVDLSVVDFPSAAPGAQTAFVSSRHPDVAFGGDERPEQPSYGEAWLGRQPGTRNDSAAYLRFGDPSAITGYANVLSTSLELFPYWGSADGVEADVSGVTTDWARDSLTYLTQPAADIDLGTVTLTPGAWSSFDMQDAPLPAFGLRIAPHAGPDTWIRLITRDQSDAVQFGPRLVVNWTPASAMPTDWQILEPVHHDD
ncbi:MAG TPA: DNRLRE domain-containing protein [Candidatus Limnocylindria bacterium]|nr:DNRLRE domain-containing protein [Candidatus Limnocylindria bacterium]